MTITPSSTAGPCHVGTATAIQPRDIARDRWVTPANQSALGAGPQASTQGLGEAISGTHEDTRDRLQGSAWVILINLAVAKHVIRRPRSRRTRTAVKVAAP